jgi:hypothetical protein
MRSDIRSVLRSVILRVVLGGSLISASAAAQPSVPARIEGPGFRVLLVTPATAAAIDQPRSVRALFASCQRELQLFPADSLAAQTVHDWDDGASVEPERLTVYVFPRARASVECGGEALRDQVAVTRGLQLLTPSPFTAADDVRRMELRVGDRAIRATVTERVPLTVLSNRGVQETAVRAMRIRIPIADLSPTATGRLDGIALHVWMADSLKADTIAIPWSTVEPLWHSYLAARSARASAAVRSPLPPYRLPPSSDADLAAAITFASLSDTTATRVLLAGLLRREPCLTLSETAPAVARAVITPIVRADARCTALPMARVAWRSAVLPGLGRPVRGARAVAQRLLIGGAIGAGLATGVSQNAQARTSYEAYQAARSSPDASRLFAQATSARSTARAGFVVATLAWGLSMTESVVREWRLSRRLARVRNVAPALSVDR